MNLVKRDYRYTLGEIAIEYFRRHLATTIRISLFEANFKLL